MLHQMMLLGAESRLGRAGGSASETTALTLYSDNAESVEWFNMCWRKVSILLF